MIYQKLSNRQLLSMLWWRHSKFKDRDAIICDGSIRSGKTLTMSVGFVLWAMSCFNGCKFAICGKTIESLRRNVVMNLRDWIPYDLEIVERRAENKLVISDGTGRENTFFMFGGRDESSYMLIQGMTLAGVLMDEVALMPRSFVEQALARCSVQGSKFWFNCNPAGPEHWFYKEWVCRIKEHNALHIHFTMADNLSLTEKIRKRYESMFVFSPVFYDRYIRGLWVVAEGLVYPGFDNAAPTVPREYEKYVISMDYGIQNPTAMGLWGLCDGVWYQVAEYYHSGRETNQQKTDQQYYDELVKLAGDLPIWRLIIDPSASSFIALVNQKKRFTILKANNDVLGGIQHTAQCLAEGKIKVNDCCERTLQEYGLYRWDEKSNEDKPIKENDHAMDMTRYFVNTMGIWRKKTNYTSLIYR